MTAQYCEKCGRVFYKTYNYNRHIDSCLGCEQLYSCEYCSKEFTRIDNLRRHQLCRCGELVLNSKKKNSDHFDIGEYQNGPKYEKLRKQLLDDLSKNIKPTVTNNLNLSVICVGKKDDYLEMLSEKWDNFDCALEYVKTCGLSMLAGDCKLLGKIYLDPDQPADQHPIKKKKNGRILYTNENKQVIEDITGKQLGQKLASNLQSTYLHCVNYIMNNSGKNHAKIVKLEDYDLECMNQHIYLLADEKNYKKIVGGLEIPIMKEY